MRAISNIISAVIALSAIMVAGIAAYALMYNEYSIIKQNIHRAYMASKPFKAQLLINDSNGCQDGVLQAKLKLPSSNHADSLIIIGTNGTTKFIKLTSYINESTRIELKCDEDYVIVVGDTNNKIYWTYSFDNDPNYPCLSGSIISPRKLLELKYCKPYENTYAILSDMAKNITSSASTNAAKYVLKLLYGSSLTPILWLGYTSSPASIASTGVAPGVNFEPTHRGLAYYSFYSSQLYHKKYITYGTNQDKYPFSRRVYYYKYGIYHIGDNDRLFYRITAYDAYVYTELSGKQGTIGCGSREPWGPCLGIIDFRSYPALVVHALNLDSISVQNTVAYILIPFLIARDSSPFTLYVGLYPATWNLTYKGGVYDAEESFGKVTIYGGKNYQGSLGIVPEPIYYRITIYVLEPNQYSSNTIISEIPCSNGNYKDIFTGKTDYYMVQTPLWKNVISSGQLFAPLEKTIAVKPSTLFSKSKTSSQVLLAILAIMVASPEGYVSKNLADIGGSTSLYRFYWINAINGIDLIFYIYADYLYTSPQDYDVLVTPSALNNSGIQLSLKPTHNKTALQVTFFDPLSCSGDRCFGVYYEATTTLIGKTLPAGLSASISNGTLASSQLTLDVDYGIIGGGIKLTNADIVTPPTLLDIISDRGIEELIRIESSETR